MGGDVLSETPLRPESVILAELLDGLVELEWYLVELGVVESVVDVDVRRKKLREHRSS